jgi:hypothetical protein
MKLHLFVLFVLLTAGFTSQAQNDRVISTNGDTVACEVYQPFFHANKASYRYKTSNGDSRKITADSVKEFYNADRSIWFRRVIADRKKHWFMSVVEDGKINLYEIIVTTTSPGANGVFYNNSNTEWYVSKGSDTVTILKGKLFGREKRKNGFAELLADNKTVYDRYMADDKFGFDEIRNLVHLYNTGELYRESSANEK